MDIYIKLLGHSGQGRGINIMPIILAVQIFQGFAVLGKARAIYLYDKFSSFTASLVTMIFSTFN